MDAEIPEFHEKLERQLGCHFLNHQFFCNRQEGHLYDKRHRITEFHLPEELNRQRSLFPSDTAFLKALFLATFEATKKWISTIRNWAQVYGGLNIMYEGRLPE